ncbi:IclR family transcriptional regulator [Variovorax sp. J22R133]|uniref:IclR family transcriptional regulator n=1 Tax=Variovorax brevis TaxID=3053503 RepID=UPI002575CC80|nr:IclR family transcriptional regulator [Variovorax sp. J22R133]MDM0113711.1 IclR family transcriptional regulator [Variovorax sp. J22R133]
MSVNPDSTVLSASRALAILDVFTVEEPHLGLSEIGRRVKLPKATALRLLKTLASSGYVAQNERAEWRLGPATASLGARYQVSFDIRANIEPALRKLSDATGHDASFFVQEGDRRVRLVKVMFPDARHSNARVGESMPLDQGAAGKVMLAAMGQRGEIYDQIRARGFHVTVGEAKKASASIAVPVFGSRWRVVGALCIGAPAEGNVADRLAKLAPRLKRAAESLSASLSYDDDSAVQRVTMARSTWHP